MEKVDYKTELKHLYKPSGKDVSEIDVPRMNFLMADGEGDPNNSQAFQDAIEALFSLSYALKFMVKKGEAAVDFGVMPLEGLWWMDDMSAFDLQSKAQWKWTLMIMQPELITGLLFEDALAQVKKKKNLAALPNVRFEAYKEGKAAQIMHIGPFAEEGPTVEKIHNFIQEKSFSPSGKHHEIYLSDFRKTAPEKLKTIIRQPYK